jgi:serine protease
VYVVSVNRSGLADGLYSGQVTVQSDVNTVSISVVMSVGAAGIGGDVGFIYLLLIDADTGVVIDQLTPQAAGGIYEYTFSGVAAGAYELVAGTDADNDFTICDRGEACGIYLTIDQPIRLNVNGDHSNLNFPIGYLVVLPTVTTTNDATAESSRSPFRSQEQQTKVIAR